MSKRTTYCGLVTEAFLGQDSSDTVRTREELQDFWHHLADDLVKTEKVTDTINCRCYLCT